MKKYLLSASAFLSIFALSQLQNKLFAYEFIDGWGFKVYE